MSAMKDHFLMLAAYNRWANNLLLGAVEKLDDEQYHKNVGAYFGSIHATLNHVLVADHVWLARFAGEADPYDTLDDVIIHDTFADLKEAREKEDGRIIAMVQMMSEADLSATFRFRTLRKPLVEAMPTSHALAHFFNHHTHHRGQVSVMLTQFGLKTPAMDMLYFQRDLQTGKVGRAA
jgi:uncharacterized damage-inducible protein DinB